MKSKTEHGLDFYTNHKEILQLVLREVCKEYISAIVIDLISYIECKVIRKFKNGLLFTYYYIKLIHYVMYYLLTSFINVTCNNI